MRYTGAQASSIHWASFLFLLTDRSTLLSIVTDNVNVGVSRFCLAVRYCYGNFANRSYARAFSSLLHT